MGVFKAFFDKRGTTLQGGTSLSLQNANLSQPIRLFCQRVTQSLSKQIIKQKHIVMKKLVVLFFSMLITIVLNAQDSQEIPRKAPKYKDLKKESKYHPSNYDKDVHRMRGYAPTPVGMGFASFFIPGLGQFIESEGAAGGGFMGAWVGSALIFPPLILPTGIWSSVHAVRRAKAQNLYYYYLLEDLKKFDKKLREDHGNITK